MRIENLTNEQICYHVWEQTVDCTQPRDEHGELPSGQDVELADLHTALCKVCLTPSKPSDLNNFTWVQRNVPQDAKVQFSAGDGSERRIDLVRNS